jgi:hypothetical protein
MKRSNYLFCALVFIIQANSGLLAQTRFEIVAVRGNGGLFATPSGQSLQKGEMFGVFRDMNGQRIKIAEAQLLLINERYSGIKVSRFLVDTALQKGDYLMKENPSETDRLLSLLGDEEVAGNVPASTARQEQQYATPQSPPQGRDQRDDHFAPKGSVAFASGFYPDVGYIALEFGRKGSTKFKMGYTNEKRVGAAAFYGLWFYRKFNTGGGQGPYIGIGAEYVADFPTAATEKWDLNADLSSKFTADPDNALKRLGLGAALGYKIVLWPLLVNPFVEYQYRIYQGTLKYSSLISTTPDMEIDVDAKENSIVIGLEVGVAF